MCEYKLFIVFNGLLAFRHKMLVKGKKNILTQLNLKYDETNSSLLKLNFEEAQRRLYSRADFFNEYRTI